MTLPTCPREDCTAACDHTHVLTTGKPYPCFLQVGGSCTGHQIDRNYNTTRCYAPRTPQPQPAAVVLPTVDEAARVIPEAWANPSSVGSVHLIAAQAVLDLIAARLPVWHPVEPGTAIKAGTRWRCESGEGATLRVEEETAATPYTCRPSACRYFIDPRTVPAEPEDPCVELVAEELHNHGGCEETWPRCSVSTADHPNAPYCAVENYRNDARDLLARIDAVRSDA